MVGSKINTTRTGFSGDKLNHTMLLASASIKGVQGHSILEADDTKGFVSVSSDLSVQHISARCSCPSERASESSRNRSKCVWTSRLESLLQPLKSID
jgi:hypothetical protein